LAERATNGLQPRSAQYFVERTHHGQGIRQPTTGLHPEDGVGKVLHFLQRMLLQAALIKQQVTQRRSV
jgi:hypothetical protein